MPYWVAFDLDQTIGCFDAVHPYLTVFFPDALQEVYKAPHWAGPEVPKLNINATDKKRLVSAYKVFVKLMAVSEDKNRLLRPGITSILGLLLKAKKEGKVGDLMIYSNNSNPHMLQFAHDLLKTIMGLDSDIFCRCVHWWDPIRDSELRSSKVPLMLGHGVKTVDTIQSTFLACDGVRVSSADVLFFDDLIHPKIHDIIPAQNYFHVQPYRRHGDFDNTHNAFLTAFMVKDLDQKLSVMAEYKKVGLSIGNEPEHADSFKAQVPTGKNVNIFDSELIFKRLRKMLRVDMEYKTNYSKVNNVEQPLNKSLTVKMKAKGLFNGGSKRRTMKLRN